MKQTLKGIKVYKIWHGWIGIGSLPDGKKVLIKGWALPGSIVDVRVVKRRKDFIEAHIVHTKKYDPHFADGEIFCPHYFIPKGVSEVNAGTAKIGCGGCKWQMMRYERQLELKQQLVEESFKKINAKCRDGGAVIRFLPIIGSPLTQGYRNKIEFSFGVFKQQSEEYREWKKQQSKQCRDGSWTRPNEADEQHSKSPLPWQNPPYPPLQKGAQYTIDNQRWCGFHKQGEFSKIVDIESCGLVSGKANQIFQSIKKLCFDSGLPVYDQKTHQGFFRHLVIREGVNTGQLMVNLSVSLANLSDEQTKVWEELLEQLKADPVLREGVTTFLITYNEGLADTVKNDKSETKVFWGDGYIHEVLNFDATPLRKGGGDEGAGGSDQHAEQWTSWRTSPIPSRSLCRTGSSEGGKWQVTFRISPFSFFQTNTHGAEKLFSTAFAMLGHIEGDILDLYCGTGSIGLSLLALGNTPLQKGGRSAATGGSKQQLIGIEIVEEAIVDALHNAKINGLQERCSFIASPAEKIAISPEIWKADVLPCQGEEPVGRRGLKDLDVVVIDPPRDGLHKNVIEWIVNLKKEQDFKLLYISCNPVTMARDVEMFLEAGFKLKEVQAVDMFPHTHHVECVGVLG